MKRGPPTREDKLLQAWVDRESKKLTFKEIMRFAKEKGLARQTAVNYLARLLEAGKIKKVIDENWRPAYILVDKKAFFISGITEALSKLTTDELGQLNVLLLILLATKKQSKSKDAFNLAFLKFLDMLNSQAALEKAARGLG